MLRHLQSVPVFEYLSTDGERSLVDAGRGGAREGEARFGAGSLLDCEDAGLGIFDDEEDGGEDRLRGGS